MNINRRGVFRRVSKAILAERFLSPLFATTLGAGLIYCVDWLDQEKTEDTRKRNAINRILFGLRHRNEVVKEMLETYFWGAKTLTEWAEKQKREGINNDLYHPGNLARLLYYAVLFISPARFMKYGNIPLRLEDLDWLLAESEGAMHDIDKKLQRYEMLLALNEERANLFAEILSVFSGTASESPNSSEDGFISRAEFLFFLSTLHEDLEATTSGRTHLALRRLEILDNLGEYIPHDLLIRYVVTSVAFFDRLGRLFEWNQKEEGINISHFEWSMGANNQLRKSRESVPNMSAKFSIFIPVGEISFPFTAIFKELRTAGEASGIDNLIELPKALRIGRIDKIRVTE